MKDQQARDDIKFHNQMREHDRDIMRRMSNDFATLQGQFQLLLDHMKLEYVHESVGTTPAEPYGTVRRYFRPRKNAA